MSSHWYAKDGSTAYGASLKEAREMGYLPSVTTVDKVIANEGLEIWKVRQAVMSALTMPKLYYPDELNNYHAESDADYIARILDDSRQQARKAAKLGSVIHKLAERYISGKPLFFRGARADVWTLFEPLRIYIDEALQKGESEVVLIGDGYAGKADYISKDIIADFKTTFMTASDVKKDGTIKKAKIYDSWGRQLAALQATGRGHRDCVSVIISTNVDYPGVWFYYWSQLELDKHYEVFKSALNIYRIQKGL
jgi:hypothetical protein